jgi:glycyl-tRNA synthetase beta chain
VQRSLDHVIERKGPAIHAAFDAQGQPTPACIGFARSCGLTPADLTTIKNAQGEWVGVSQNVAGKAVADIMPTLIEQAVLALPIPKRMRWGDNETSFTRPIHAVMMLYGDSVITGKILGYAADRLTRGHRYHSSGWLTSCMRLSMRHYCMIKGM